MPRQSLRIILTMVALVAMLLSLSDIAGSMISVQAATSVAPAANPTVGPRGATPTPQTRVGQALPKWRQPSKPPSGLTTTLHRLVQAQQEGFLAEATKELGVELDGDHVRVTIEARRGQAAAAQAAAAVANRGRPSHRAYDYIDASVPVAALPMLLRNPEILTISLPNRPVPAVTSEGVGEVGAPFWQANGLTGSGVKIGIIDAGFTGYSARLGSELPAGVNVNTSCTQSALEPVDQDHGVAVAEVVYDMAPAAQLYLAAASNPNEVQAAMTCLASYGVQIINHSAE